MRHSIRGIGLGLALYLVFAGQPSMAAEGRITIPLVSGRAGVRTFSGHPGWVSAYRRGYGAGTSARIDGSGKFTLPQPDRPVCLIATFDKIETPPLVVPNWPQRPGEYDLAIPVEYACAPAEDRIAWDSRYMLRAGDLCCLVFGNHHGQIVENQIRSEEWEIFIPQHRLTLRWGQTFTAHGVSLAGVVFWAGSAQPGGVDCEVRIRRDGPWGDLLKPVKVAHAQISPARPIIRYPDTPSPLPGYEAYYKLPCNLFQAAWLPDELPLLPGKTYCVEIIASQPIMLYADGDYYDGGYAYYEGLKVEQQWHGHATKHSPRWTLAMSIVSYANPGGAPLSGTEPAAPAEKGR